MDDSVVSKSTVSGGYQANPSKDDERDAFPLKDNPLLKQNLKEPVQGEVKEWGTLRYGVPKDSNEFPNNNIQSSQDDNDGDEYKGPVYPNEGNNKPGNSVM